MKDVFSNIYENWGFGGYPDSRSGPGSTLQETEEIRKEIRRLVAAKEIKTVVDIPCGDFHWMKEIVYGFEKYTGGDIVPAIIQDNQKYANQVINFIEFDLAGNEEIPEADLLIVRDVIGHLPLEQGKKIIENILKSKCKYLLSTTWYNINDAEYYKTHHNTGATLGRFYPVCLSAEPFNLPLPETYIQELPIVDSYDKGNRKGLALWDLEVIRGNKHMPPSNLTVVTGLWNIGREERNFEEHYIPNFKKLLETDVNMFIFIPAQYEHVVWEIRKKHNTVVKVYELEDVKQLYAPFWDKTQEIRTNTEWLNSTGENGWLKNSPQAKLEWYNPIVMSKMFMMHDVSIWNPFSTDYFLWLDAGLTNTVYEKYFTEHHVLDKILPHLSSFLFLSYPYEARDEIHGMKYSYMNRVSGEKVFHVCRGGLFGGHKDVIREANSTYYSLVAQTLAQNEMGTEESIFTLMSYLHPEKYRRYALDSNGLVVKFVQALLEDAVVLEPIPEKRKAFQYVNLDMSSVKTSLYMLTFNFPEQVRHTLETYKQHPEWLTKTRKILIDNSTNDIARQENKTLCAEYGFEHIITEENLGINRGRFLAAKHFDESDSDYYIFLEDDMGLHPESSEYCRNGLRTYVPDLYTKIHKIIWKEKFDFLKLSFTEVYMDNYIQCSWYNVPQTVRTEVWPNYHQLPTTGLDPNCPRTEFKKIDYFDGLLYASGDVYYANWPMIMSKEGNRKVFLETTWQNPFEQTWMSHIFQETRKGNIHPAVLLASPILHNRIAHYKPEERREN